MKENSHIYKIIGKYLLRKEQKSEKQEIITWYDSYDLGYSPTEEHIEDTGKSVKQKVFQSIKNERSTLPTLTLWKPIAIAVSFLLVFGLTYSYLSGEKEEMADMKLLSTISPAKPQARITLENGEIIDLENLPIDSCIKIDHIEITKNSAGQITYSLSDDAPKISGENIIETPTNANYTLVLPDGTTVLLNVNTKLKYPRSFDNDDRIVELNGEAYFVVANHNQQKFIVKTQQQTTEVLGTKFNVKAKDNQITEVTTLEEGSIRVVNNNTLDTEFIKPGQQVELNYNNTKIQQVELEPFLAWTKGYFYMDESNISEVLQEIADWYDIDIDFTKSKSLTTYKGKIPKNMKLDELIKLLEHIDLKVKPTVAKDKIKLIVK